MFKISLASRLAIAFIRPFRSYLDGYLLSKEEKIKFENEIKSKIDSMTDQNRLNNPSLHEKYISWAKECMIYMNMEMLNRNEQSYSDVLPDVVDELTVALEKTISSSFSENEINEINEILKNPLVQKVLSNKLLFELLKKHELDLEYRAKVKAFESILGESGIQNIKDTFSILRKKYNLPEQNKDDGEWREDTGNWN